MSEKHGNNYVCNICKTSSKKLGIKLGVTAVRCPKCGFVWKDTELLPDDYKKTWRYGTSESSDARNSHSVFDYRLQKMLETSKCKLNKIMDFGCGGGAFVRYLRSNDYDSYGCDLGDNIPDDPFFFKKNISGVNEYNFDAIVSIETFEHIQDVNLLVAELAKRLRQDGMLYIETQFTHIDSILGWGYFDLANHISFHNPKSMQKLMNNCGIELVYFDNNKQSKNILWFMRKFVHLSHVMIPYRIQESSFYKNVLGLLEQVAKAVFGEKVVVQPCKDYVSGVLKTSNCVFVGIKR
jgi:SAM-dependent methyltransferase